MINRSSIPRTRLAAVLLITVTIFGADPCLAALQYQPVDGYSIGDECALVLNGPGRSSAFDYTYNLLRGSLPPSAGSQTCITYDAVNHAYIEARKRINVAQPTSENWRGEDLATVGELLLDISINLAQKYGLTYEDVENGLPLIDTSKTLIREVCPAYLSNVECQAGKYRRYDGLCTNLENPTWGATMTPFSRLLPPKYSDGINAPRISVTGNDLPLARVVSRTMHPDEGYHDHAGTVMVIAWGQFMDHDYTLTATPLDLHNRNDPEECCNRPPHLKNPYCNEILIPEDDYFYKLFNVRCMDFVRGFPAPRPGCRLGSRVQFNLLTGVLDGNTVYGVSETFARKLRTGYGGLLRMNPVFSEYGLKDLLPLKLDIPDEGCTRHNRSMFCFEAGEIRVNEQLVLTCMHTLLAREHNRVANALAQVNPHWDDETIFQEARRINIAEIQHVTYNEFLPILLGKEVMEKFGLLLEKDGYWDGYDSTVNPNVLDAFASAAYRFGHSLLPTAVERWSKAHKFIASKRLSDLIRRPYDLYRAGVLDEYFMGLMNQVAQAMDDSITQEVTNHLFKKVGAKHGMDLVSFNMQRGREFGIPSYMEFRKFCGLPGADTFEELFGSMPNETIRRYSSIFEHPSDVDLWSGGVSERPLPGSMLGPTFACIIATQFSYSRRGDRFWYELPNQPSSFTPEQLVEIRKSRLSRLICDNTDLIDTIQLYPMVLPDHEINPRVPCRSGVLPSMDFSKWAEFPSGAGHAAEYNFLRSWLPPLKVMPPLAYARIPKTPRRELAPLPKRRAFDLATLLPPRRTALSYAREPTKTPDRKSRNRPAMIMIERSTRIYGQMPMSDDEIRNNFLNDPPRSGYVVEKSEVQISSPMNQVFREKRYSIKAFFDHLSRRGRSRRDITKESDSDQAENASRLLSILARNHRTSDHETRKDTTSHTRSKRQVPEVATPRKLRKGKRKSGYTPVFEECKDAAASEISDLNAPPPPPQRRLTLQPYSVNGDIDISRRKNRPPVDAREKKLRGSGVATTAEPLIHREEVIEPPKEPASSVKSTSNATYINLQDHQKGTQDGILAKDANGYPIDIPPYNPDVIPYVDVPDYSDRREESLDKDDRRVAKEKFVEYPDEDVEAVDPGVPVSGEKKTEKITANDETDQRPEVKEDEQVKEQKEEVEKEKENEETASEDVEDPKSNSGTEYLPLMFDINDYIKPFNLDELFADIRKDAQKLERMKKSKEDATEHQGSKNIPVREIKQVVIPKFSLPFLAPVKKEALNSDTVEQEEGDKEEALSSDRVEEDKKEALSSDRVEEEDKKEDLEEELLPPPNFYEEFDKIFGPSATKKPFGEYFGETDDDNKRPSGMLTMEDHEKYPYGDENTYERLFGGKDEEDESESVKAEEDGEADYKLDSEDDDEGAGYTEEKKSEEVEEADEPTDESLKKAYKTLAGILDRKDDVSRLDDEVAEAAKKEGKMPPMYNNYWTLEYGTPTKVPEKT